MNEYVLFSTIYQDDTIPIGLDRNILQIFFDAKLTEREILVLIQRFGLISGRVKTLEEVGNHYSVTRERIRITERHALDKLRQHLSIPPQKKRIRKPTQ